ncbi:precorrin-2 C(20)-methyltransferase [uncultured Bacteroides sp.]|uniref:precorrin-2 C(20)-methyltransferase n=1 Tax=uncultured Bacteroides sp. TaxID=162156 RepID=UPI002AA8C736|nr:precorrin-2 C(20)-methyltransferase [uncultured Bacteroides sp.]
MHTPILFVSLGPGDPELITLKGLKALQAADCVFCPATITRSGKQLSRSSDIVKSLGISVDHIFPFLLPMSKDRSQAFLAYDSVYADAINLYRQGRQVVIVAEGDAGFYSSIHYVYEKLQANAVPVEQIAGIPAFIASGALAGMHIVSQEEKLMVLPGNVSADELDDYLKEGFVLVIMKLSQCTQAVHQLISRSSYYAYHYFENVGTEKEYYTLNADELVEKEFPYFSLMIIRKI